jgi:hypothetical protein
LGDEEFQDGEAVGCCGETGGRGGEGAARCDGNRGKKGGGKGPRVQRVGDPAHEPRAFNPVPVCGWG